MWSKNDNKENFDYKDTVKNKNYIYLVHSIHASTIRKGVRRIGRTERSEVE